MSDKRKPKPPASDRVKVILISALRWDGVDRAPGTVLEMSQSEAADYIALRFAQPVSA
jgi:hypothetical protein